MQIRFLGCFGNIGLDFPGIFKFVRQRADIFVLRRQNHIGNAESRIRTGRENGQLFVTQRRAVIVGQAEVKLGAFRTADPVNLLRFDAVNKIQPVQIVDQTVGVFGNRNHPLFFVFAHHLRAAALAAAVDNLFVGQADLAGRAPVDGNFVFIGQSLFKELDEHPLCPLEIFRRRGVNTSVPVKTEAKRFQLFGKGLDVGLRRNRRVHTGFDGVVFGRQPESVKAHRIQNVEALHAFFTGNDVQSGVRARMSDMQTGAGRIRKFDQGIKFFLVMVDFYLVGFLIVPDFLPLFLNGMKIVPVFQRPLLAPFFKICFAVVSGIVLGHFRLFLSSR